LQYELAKLREEKCKDQDEINRLRDSVAIKERECQDNDARIKSIDYDLYKAQERANQLSKLADAKEFELRKITENMEHANSDLQRTKDDHSRLMVESQALQRNLDSQLANKSDLQRQAENEDAKNRDFQGQLYEREQRYR
jgi:chromosome segregation ATPase